VLDLEPGGVAVLTAPAGYGSSVLLVEVAREADQPVAWVSCPAEDRTTVWRHVLAALARVGVPTAEPATLLGTDDGPGFRTCLLNSMAAAPQPFLLLLDDLEPHWHDDFLADLRPVADSLPGTTRLVLRTEPEGWVPRRRATTGRLVVVTGQDLVLSAEDAAWLVATLEPDLPPDRVKALVGLAEGWATALTAPFARGARDPEDDPAAWLLDDGAASICAVVLDSLPDAERELALTIAVLGPVTTAQVALATGCPETDVARTLDSLSRRGLLRPQEAFVPGSIGLGRLLREYARNRASLRGPTELARLNRAAAEWLLAAGDSRGAIDHALDAGNLVWALKLLEGAVGSLMDGGHAPDVHGFYRRTPEPLLAENTVHLLAAAWSELLSGNVSVARRRLDQLIDVTEELRHRQDDLPADLAPVDGEALGETGLAWLEAEVLLLRAYVAWWRGRPRRAQALAESARDAFGNRWTRTAHQAAEVQALRPVVWFGDADQAKAGLLAVATRAGVREPLRGVQFPGLRAVLSVREGRVRRGASVAQGVVWAAQKFGAPAPFDSADARLAIAQAHVDLGDPAAALAHAVDLGEQACDYGHVTYLMLAHAVEADALVRLGRSREALQVLVSARRDVTAEGGEVELLRYLDGAEARARLETGDRTGASALLRRVPAGPSTDLLAVRLAPRGTEEMLRRLRSFRPVDVRQSVQSQLLMASALAAVRPAEAQAHLLRAAGTAENVGLLSALFGLPDAVWVMAERVADKPGGAAVGVLVRHGRVQEPPPTAAPAPRVRLSDGEKQLLVVMDEHVGQRALADALGVSVNTVKTRLRRLYQKLGVSERESALAAARASGVLTPPR
jgi:LuxR family maltose regulon positive regulatory protein